MNDDSSASRLLSPSDLKLSVPEPCPSSVCRGLEKSSSSFPTHLRKTFNSVSIIFIVLCHATMASYDAAYPVVGSVAEDTPITAEFEDTDPEKSGYPIRGCAALRAA